MSSTVQTVEPPATAVAVKSRLLAGLLVVQIIVGFEFFWSVVTKLVRGVLSPGWGRTCRIASRRRRHGTRASPRAS